MTGPRGPGDGALGGASTLPPVQRGVYGALALVVAITGAVAAGVAPAGAAPTQADGSVAVLSGRADMVTGDDVLVGAPKGSTFRIDGGQADASEVRPEQWLVTGLDPGRHVITVATPSGKEQLRVRAFPTTGPVFSGPHMPLLACSTEQAGLGAPTDDDCSAPTKVSYQYRTTGGTFAPLPDGSPVPADVATVTVDGSTVPYVVRTESGVIDRAVYWISILDPSPGAEEFDADGWNGRLVYRYGGGCGQSYGQGSTLAINTMSDALLSKGYAVATATFNTYQVQCNTVLSAETTMMVKERFAEAYGVPEFTIGDGGSGGAIQQLGIAQNYPGLLDAIAPTVPFPDAISIAPGVSDCGLLGNYFESGPGAALTDDQRTAISGYDTWGSCELWISSFLSGIRPEDGCDPSIPPAEVYDAETNPGGIRCDLADANVNQVGTDPETGFANRALGNVGVQYGLEALNAGTITPTEFLDLNEGVGGYDVDGGFVAERTNASAKVFRRIYEIGGVLEGDEQLRALPIVTTNFYTDPGGDIHTRFRLFTIRERLKDEGTIDENQVIVTRGSTGSPTATLTGAIGDPAEQTALLDEWLTTGKRPAAAVDTCYGADGGVIARGDDVEDVERTCNETYPSFGDVRTAAGAPLINDILSCRRQPVDPSGYEVTFSKAERSRLREVFPDGVCDWSKPGFGQVPKIGTWIDYSNPKKPVALGER